MILLDDFAQAVHALKGELASNGTSHFLLASRRKSVAVSGALGFEAPDWAARLQQEVTSKGSRDGSGGLDLLLYNRGLFSDIPPFALGRTAWDNWLVWKAEEDFAVIIDATATFIPIHQAHHSGCLPGTVQADVRASEIQRNVGLAEGHLLSLTDARTHILTCSGLKFADLEDSSGVEATAEHAVAPFAATVSDTEAPPSEARAALVTAVHLAAQPEIISVEAPIAAADTKSYSDAEPLVSIITICRNGMPYLRACIDSILEQDYPNIEFIVQDGASTDDTVELLESYGDRIKWVSSPDSGHGEALNRALLRCKGEIIGTCNADDCLQPNAASWAVRNLAERPETGAIYGDFYTTNGEDDILRGPVQPHAFDYEKVLCVEHVPPMQSAFFRRSSLAKAGLLSGDWLPAHCEDYAIWVILGLHAAIEYIPGTVATYRVHAGSETSQADVYRKFYTCKREVLELMMLDPGTPYAVKALRNRALGGLALWVAETFLDTFSDPTTAMRYIGMARSDQPDREHLEQLFERVKACLPQITVFTQQGFQLLSDNRFAEALEIFDAAMAIDCWMVDVGLMRASCLIGLQRLEEAQQALKRELDLHPDNADAKELAAVVRSRIGETDADLEPATVVLPTLLPYSFTRSTPKIDLILPGPPDSLFSWNQREGFARALIQLGMLNKIYWVWDNEAVVENMFRNLENSDADLVMLTNGDQHMACVYDTEAKRDRWRALHMPVVCHGSERVLGSSFLPVERQTRAALDTFDAFFFIDELSSDLFESSGKPSLWVPQYVDDTVFQNGAPLEARDGRIYFRGQVSDFGFPGAYTERRALLSALEGNPLFDLSEAYRPALTLAEAAQLKSGYRFLLNAPANCPGYSSSLYEGLASGCIVFQYQLQREEKLSRALFQPGVHFIGYDPSQPDVFLNEAAYAAKHWQDFAMMAKEGHDECLAHHTIRQRMLEVMEFVDQNWSRITKQSGVPVYSGEIDYSLPIGAPVATREIAVTPETVVSFTTPITASDLGVSERPWNEAIPSVSEASSEGTMADAALLNKMGEERFREGDLEAALAAFQKAAEYGPDLAAVQNNLGVLYWERGDVSLSCSHFVRAVELDPDDTSIVFNCASVLANTEQRPAAEDLCVTYLRRNPNDEQVNRLLASVRETI